MTSSHETSIGYIPSQICCPLAENNTHSPPSLSGELHMVNERTLYKRVYETYHQIAHFRNFFQLESCQMRFDVVLRAELNCSPHVIAR
jgi:hypothetical protein